MLDTLPPSVPTGSARAARTAGKKLEFAREYCSRCAVSIRLLSRPALSTQHDAGASTYQNTQKAEPKIPKMDRCFRSYATSADYEARHARMTAVGAIMSFAP